MNSLNTRSRSIGGAVIAFLLIALGALVIIDTRGYGDADSAVFPRAVAIAMILVCTLILVRAVIRSRVHKSDSREPPARGSWLRRILLPVIMLSSASMMKAAGFVPAMLVMFAGVLLVANYDTMTLRRALIYTISGIAVVVGFYLVFRYWLLVPLP